VAEVQHHYQESLGESTTTSTTYQDKVTLTFTPDANSDYLLIPVWEHGNNGAGEGATRLYHDTAATELALSQWTRSDNLDRHTPGAFAVQSFGSSPSSQTYKLQYKRVTGSNPTVAIKNASILALKLTAADEWDDALSGQGTTSTDLDRVGGEALTLGFTPATTGDYLIFASCQTAGIIAKLRLDVDASPVWDSTVEENTYTQILTGAFAIVNLSAASHAIDLRWAAGTTGTATISNARLIAIRLDRFANYWSQSNLGSDNTTSTSYVTRTTLTQTTAARNHMVLARAVLNQSISTSTMLGDLEEDDTTVLGELQNEPRGTAQPELWPMLAIKRRNLSAASHKYEQRFRCGASGTTTITWSQIVLIDLEEASGGGNNWDDEITDGVDAGLALAALLAAIPAQSEGAGGGDATGPSSASTTSLAEGCEAGTALTTLAALAAARSEATGADAGLAALIATGAALSEAIGAAGAQVAQAAIELAATAAVEAAAAQVGGFNYADTATEAVEASGTQAGSADSAATHTATASLAAAQATVAALATAVSAAAIAQVLQATFASMGMARSEGAAAAATATTGQAFVDSISEAAGASATQIGQAALGAAVSQGASIATAIQAAAAYYAALAQALGVADAAVGIISGPAGPSLEVLELASTIARVVEQTSTIQRRADLTSAIQRILNLEIER
jgi:hypothetical protein